MGALSRSAPQNLRLLGRGGASCFGTATAVRVVCLMFRCYGCMFGTAQHSRGHFCALVRCRRLVFVWHMQNQPRPESVFFSQLLACGCSQHVPSPSPRCLQSAVLSPLPTRRSLGCVCLAQRERARGEPLLQARAAGRNVRRDREAGPADCDNAQQGAHARHSAIALAVIKHGSRASTLPR